MIQTTTSIVIAIAVIVLVYTAIGILVLKRLRASSTAWADPDIEKSLVVAVVIGWPAVLFIYGLVRFAHVCERLTRPR